MLDWLAACEFAEQKTAIMGRYQICERNGKERGGNYGANWTYQILENIIYFWFIHIASKTIRDPVL